MLLAARYLVFMSLAAEEDGFHELADRQILYMAFMSLAAKKNGFHLADRQINGIHVGGRQKEWVSPC